MTKILWIGRHAKSSWDSPESHDMKRPLLEKGIERTRRVLACLRDHEVRPDLILASPAVRAHETANLLAVGLDYPLKDIRLESDLYFGTQDLFWSIVFGIPNHLNTVMIVGHNPGMTEIANYFLKEKLDYLPTSALVSISFDTNKWEEINRVNYRVNHLIIPKSLKG